MDDWKKKKIVFFNYFISEIPDFSYMGFFRKCSMFRRSMIHLDEVIVFLKLSD